MKLELAENGIMIIPETCFEAQFLERIDIDNTSLFHKHGMTANEYVGLKLKQKEVDDND